MARIQFYIDDPVIHLTLKAMLESEGHTLVTSEPDVAVYGSATEAARNATRYATLLLTTAGGISEAVNAMGEGVFGYIFIPLQPHEAGLMVKRALGAMNHGAPAAEVEVPPQDATLEAAELHYIKTVLRQCKYNRAKAARVLGIGRNTLWRKLKKNDSDPP